uniref:DUF5710 domain-containing protein n=1 Tax=Rhabditophanes sp. KR3021 TaxID=114890 RepID=A0AC35TJI6_9BILA
MCEVPLYKDPIRLKRLLEDEIKKVNHQAMLFLCCKKNFSFGRPKRPVGRPRKDCSLNVSFYHEIQDDDTNYSEFARPVFKEANFHGFPSCIETMFKNSFKLYQKVRDTVTNQEFMQEQHNAVKKFTPKFSKTIGKATRVPPTVYGGMRLCYKCKNSFVYPFKSKPSKKGRWKCIGKDCGNLYGFVRCGDEVPLDFAKIEKWDDKEFCILQIVKNEGNEKSVKLKAFVYFGGEIGELIRLTNGTYGQIVSLSKRCETIRPQIRIKPIKKELDDSTDDEENEDDNEDDYGLDMFTHHNISSKKIIQRLPPAIKEELPTLYESYPFPRPNLIKRPLETEPSKQISEKDIEQLIISKDLSCKSLLKPQLYSVDTPSRIYPPFTKELSQELSLNPLILVPPTSPFMPIATITKRKTQIDVAGKKNLFNFDGKKYEMGLSQTSTPKLIKSGKFPISYTRTIDKQPLKPKFNSELIDFQINFNNDPEKFFKFYSKKYKTIADQISTDQHLDQPTVNHMIDSLISTVKMIPKIISEHLH